MVWWFIFVGHCGCRAWINRVLYNSGLLLSALVSGHNWWFEYTFLVFYHIEAVLLHPGADCDIASNAVRMYSQIESSFFATGVRIILVPHKVPKLEGSTLEFHGLQKSKGNTRYFDSFEHLLKCDCMVVTEHLQILRLPFSFSRPGLITVREVNDFEFRVV